MGFNGALADNEGLGDLRIGLALNNQAQDFSFAQGQGLTGGRDKEGSWLGIEVKSIEATVGEIGADVLGDGRF